MNTEAQTDGDAASESMATVATSEAGDAGSAACAPTASVEHSIVPRSQMASSLAAVLCIAQEDCCPGAPPSPSCRHGMNMVFESLDAQATDLGLSYDGDCTGRQQATVIELGCDVAAGLDATALAACSVYFGTQREGDPCETVGTLGSTCIRGLACGSGTCVDPCTATSSGRPYVYGYACVAGDVAVNDECRKAALEGDPCSGACEEGLHCPHPDAACAPSCVGLCSPNAPLGSSCARDQECRDAICIGGTCALGQPEGAPCATGCGVGLSCDTAAALCVRTPTVCHSTVQ